jgi:hypothetical protein
MNQGFLRVFFLPLYRDYWSKGAYGARLMSGDGACFFFLGGGVLRFSPSCAVSPVVSMGAHGVCRDTDGAVPVTLCAMGSAHLDIGGLL